MDKPESGSAARDLATPETVVQNNKDEDTKPIEAPSAKEADTSEDKKLSDDQEAMQPDSA